ncbi:hypothetical protein ABPG74_014328 [Tetrahymena malaccensis]
MNSKNSGQEVGQGNQYSLENSSDLELQEVNFQQKKMSSKRNQQEEYQYEEGNDDYINIYKEPIKSEDEDQDTSQQQQDSHNQNQHYNHDNHDDDDDDDELDEVNGINQNSQRQRYASQDYQEQNHYGDDHQYQQQNYAGLVRDQIQQHNHELEHISQDYLNQQIQKNQNGYQNEFNQMPSQEIKTQLSKTSSSRQAKNNSSQHSQEQNEENIRFEKQLSKMTPEEAEIEYQNRCQKQLLELQQKQQSFKKGIDQSGTQSQANSSKQTFTIQSNNTSNQMKAQQVSQTKKQESISQSSQQQYKNQSLTHKLSQQSIKDVNSLEQLKTVKSSLMISSQETLQNNLLNTQANIQRLSQISETISKDSKVQTKSNVIKNNISTSSNTNNNNNNNNNIHIKKQYHSYQNPTQQRPQSSQPIKQDHQTELLCNIYYHGMQVKQEKEEKLKNIKSEIEAQDLQKCTFKPKLTEKAQRLSLNNNNYLPIEDKTQIYMKRKQILLEKRIEEKKKEETVGCTFKPQINPKKYKTLPQDEQHNMSVYDRQIEWQKKVSEKNTERMKNSYASIMTPSKKTENQTRNNSTQKKSNYNQQNNNSNVTITNSAKRLKGYDQEKGYFSEKRVSPTFLTYLNCKYDYNHSNSIDYQKNQEVPQILTVKPQEKDQIYQVQNFESNQNETQNQKIQKAIEVCQELENNLKQSGLNQNYKGQHSEYTFGGINQQSVAAWQQQESNQQQGLSKNSNQPKVFQSKNKNQMYLSENIQVNQSVQSMKPKHSVPSRIDQIKQTINKSLQDQFQSTKSISKSSSNAQLLKQYSYQNTIPQKVNFSGISQLNNIVIQKNHYTLNDPNSQQDIDEFQIVKQQLGNNFYRQYKEKAQQNKNSSFQEAQFFSSKSQQIAHQNNQKILYQQAIKINKEIKELQGQSRHENSQYLQQQQQQVLEEYDMNQMNQ